jgi:hypothetical protein
LSEPERKHKLGTCHQKLGSQSLEERRETFFTHHPGHDFETALRVFEVLVLDPSLDNIEGSGDDERCASTGNRSDEILSPGGGIVVLELVKVFFGSSRTTKQLSHLLDHAIMALLFDIPQMNQAHYVLPSSPNHGIVQTLHRQQS